MQKLSAEKIEMDSTLRKYEDKRIRRDQVVRNSAQISEDDLRKNPDKDIVRRTIREIETSHSEASNYLGEMNKVVHSYNERTKLLESKKIKINKIISKYVTERKRRKTLEIASNNAFPSLDIVLSYHNLVQYREVFEKLHITTSKLVQ